MNINDPFPAGSVTLKSATSKPAYGSWWRWLLRMPNEHLVTYQFEHKQTRVTHGEEEE